VHPTRRKRWSTTNSTLCKLAEWFWFRPSLNTFPSVVIRVYGFKEFQLRSGEHVWLDTGYSFVAHVWKHIKHDLLRLRIRLDTPYAKDKVYRYNSGM
jgi:hypothetical protein